MIVQCPECLTKYNLPEARLRPGDLKLQCSRCGHLFVRDLVSESGSMTSDEEAVGPLDLDSLAGAPADAGDDEFGDVESSIDFGEPESGEDDDLLDFSGESDEEEDGADDLLDFLGEDDSGEDVLGETDTAADSGDGLDLGDLSLGDEDEDEDELSLNDSLDDSGDDEETDEISLGDEDDLFGPVDEEEDDVSMADSDLGGALTFDDEDDEDGKGEDESSGGEMLDFGEDTPKRETDEAATGGSAFAIDLDSEAGKKKKKRSVFGTLLKLLFLLLLLLAGAVVAAYYFDWWGKLPPQVNEYRIAYLDPYVAEYIPTRDIGGEGEADMDEIKQISLENVRQYTLQNEKAGQVFVVEGKAVNNFPSPKSMIMVRASLYDTQGVEVVSKNVTAGNTVSLFQLQVLSQAEIEAALASEIGILSNNANIPQGGNTPFMAVFFNPPENVAEFGVKVIKAQDAE